MESLSGQLNGSALRADGRMDVSGGIPDYRMDVQVEQMEAGRILSLFTADADTPLEGSTDLRLALQARGREADSILSSLSGQVGIVVRNGVLHIGSVATAVETAIAALQRRPSATTEADTLPFALLRSSWQATDGRLHSNDLALDAGALEVTGQGHIDLPGQEADYQIMLDLGEGLKVPARISGAFGNLSHSVDLTALVADQVQRQFETFFGPGGKEPEDDSAAEPAVKLPNLIKDLF